MKTTLATAFEQVLRVAGLADLCDVCGGITAQSKPVLIIREGEEPRACEACGVWLDRDGRPAGGRDADGEVVFGVVVVHGCLAIKPDMPASCGAPS
ncbi:MAG: hypothetical protein EPO68_04150 [Planctomycetota bacterium]|nr:MAG: hypothetical protein EPO68_04150 [Planctomycetota bacterium]